MSSDAGVDTTGSHDDAGEVDVWRLATALSGATTPADVALAVAEEGAAAAGASFANMARFDRETKRVRVVHARVLDPRVAARWTDFDIGEQTPLCEAILTGTSVLLGSGQAIALRYPNLLADTLGALLSATATLPLATAGGETIGAIGFGWPRPQAFGPRQSRRLDLIARMVAQALDRALLYERERAQPSAREQAQTQLLQEAFLPRTLPHTEHLELAAAYLPARDAPMGGDWYDAFAVDGGVFLAIGDVAGHGLAAAAMMAQLRNAGRAFADEDPSPALVLARLNRMLWRVEPGETATAIVAVWNAETRTIVWANAGHPPILRCRKGEVEFLSYARGQLLLGASPDSTYAPGSKLLRAGTTLLFYTDGLIETRGSDIDAGMAELQTFVESLDDLSPQAVCREVVEWRASAASREDDLCLLAVGLI